MSTGGVPDGQNREIQHGVPAAKKNNNLAFTSSYSKEIFENNEVENVKVIPLGFDKNNSLYTTLCHLNALRRYWVSLCLELNASW